MDENRLNTLLTELQEGKKKVSEVLGLLKNWPSEDMGFACLDHHRQLRTGFPEVVFGAGKTAEQMVKILTGMLRKKTVVLATKADQQKAEFICRELPTLQYHQDAKILTGNEEYIHTGNCRGKILVVCAGTSDIPIAEEASITAHCLGNEVESLYDVGVAGMHRLLSHRELLNKAVVLIVVAGMEGALPSVIGGMVDKPVIAVPTSIGYGTSFGGVTALLGMLNSCAPGIAVVNIDNGFGAACMAAAINKN